MKIIIHAICLVALIGSTGCITVGVKPKREVRQYERPIKSNLTCIQKVEKPKVAVERIWAGKFEVRIEARQQFQKMKIFEHHGETWEIEDGKALSIGVLPGFGRIVHDSYDYDLADGWGTAGACVMLPVGAAICNCFGLIPTLSGLFYVPFVDEPRHYHDCMSEWAIIGCDRFRLHRDVGETLTEHKMEQFYASCIAEDAILGLDAAIIATVEIPSMWFRQSIVLKSREKEGQVISSAAFNLPENAIGPVAGSVTLSFSDVSGKYGDLLSPYQGMVSHFSLYL